MTPTLEKTEFDLNRFADGTWRINREGDYVCFRETRSGLAAINRALAPYQRVTSDGVCSVGNRHEICIIREMLQAIRFEQL